MEKNNTWKDSKGTIRVSFLGTSVFQSWTLFRNFGGGPEGNSISNAEAASARKNKRTKNNQSKKNVVGVFHMYALQCNLKCVYWWEKSITMTVTDSLLWCMQQSVIVVPELTFSRPPWHQGMQLLFDFSTVPWVFLEPLWQWSTFETFMTFDDIERLIYGFEKWLILQYLNSWVVKSPMYSK